MEKYRVVFEFMLDDIEISDEAYHKDFLDNNGKGFDFSEAESIACDLRMNEFCDIRNVDIEIM